MPINFSNILFTHCSTEFSSRSLWPLDGTLKGTITPGQSGPGSNSNEGVLHTTKNSRAEASQPDAINYRTQDTLFFGGGSYSSAGDTVSIFYAPVIFVKSLLLLIGAKYFET